MATPYYEIHPRRYVEKCLQTSLHPTDWTLLTEMDWDDTDGVCVHMRDTKHDLYMDVAVVCYEDGDISSIIEPWAGESDVNENWLDAFLSDYREASDWVCEQAVKYAQTLGYFAQKEDGTWVFDKNGHAEDLI